MKVLIALGILLIFLFGCSSQNKVQVVPSPTASPSPSVEAFDAKQIDSSINEVDKIDQELAQIENDLVASEEISITEIEESTLK
ncbi:MAG: hypothetical protein QXU92_03660 [Candidatus Diapherotrites archaeon]